MTTPAVAGTNPGQGQGQAQGVQPGQMFGVPMYSTQRRFIPDNGNSDLAAPQVKGQQKNVQTTRLDQLDIVQGWKIYLSINDTWNHGSGETYTKSPFYPASNVQNIQFKLQAAYNTFNQTGPLAAIAQAFRPMWGSRQVGTITPDPFANPTNATSPNLTGTATQINLAIDVPAAIKLDEYWNLSADGRPTGPALYDAIVSPMFMAAQARTISPTITMAPGVTDSDLLGGPVTTNGAGTPGTFVQNSSSLTIQRDAYWTATSPASNPPQFPWLYTRDFFTNPTDGQKSVQTLLLNTGVSLGQVLSIYGFVWDPDANSGLGAVVPMSSIETFTIVTGGSLQNWSSEPAAVTDRMRSMTGNLTTDFPSGVFVFDFALSPDGAMLSNAGAINTYLVNGVSLGINFISGSQPGSNATVYMGIEALKLATS